MLKKLAEEERAIVVYESPLRLVKTLKELSEYLGAERPCSVSRELTKMFEETIRGTLSELITHFMAHEPKGEFVIVVEGKSK